MEILLRIKETAKLLNVAPITVRRLIKNKTLNATKIGGQYRISPEELNNLISSQNGK